MDSNKIVQFFFSTLAIFCPLLCSAQSGTDNLQSKVLMIVLILIIAVVLILVLLQNSRLTNTRDGSIRLRDFFAATNPLYTNGESVIKLNKGFDINLLGKPLDEVLIKPVKRYAVRPPNFRGIAPIPKMVVAVGDEVLAGDQLFYDKSNPDIAFCSPVSGEIIEIRRGEKRAISDVVILADKRMTYKKNEVKNLSDLDRSEIVEIIKNAGFWPLIRQRPYNELADPSKIPSNIFISTFSTSPLAPKANTIVEGKGSKLQKGIDVLSKLTTGQVHLGLSANGDNPPSQDLLNLNNVKKHWFQGVHPAGNVGVQIHHIAPIKKNEVVWTLDLQHVIALGTYFQSGKYDLRTTIAVGGNQVDHPCYIETIAGANIGDLIGKINDEENTRIISGDVLTGRKVGRDDFLDIFSNQLCAIAEGNEATMFGWLMPRLDVPSLSPALPSSLFPTAEFKGNTNTNGERRAFVVTGQYERVLPMDLHPQHLFKAILANDLEQMEGLGIHELVEEDIALCEYVCTSKMPLQKILRDGLNTLKEQG